MAEFKGRDVFAVVERQHGLIERVLVAGTHRSGMRVLRKLLKEADVKINREILFYESYADWDGFEVKLTNAVFVE